MDHFLKIFQGHSAIECFKNCISENSCEDFCDGNVLIVFAKFSVDRQKQACKENLGNGSRVFHDFFS